MNNYPPPGGYGQQGYGQQQGQAYNQGYNTQSSGPPGYNQGYGQAPPPSGNQGYDSWQPGGGQNNYSGGQSGYGGGQGNYTDGQGGMGGPPQSNSYGAPSGYQQQGSHQFSQGAPAGYPQQHGDMFGDHTGGYNPQNVPVEHLPPGYNPNTRAPYQPHELPPGAQMAGPGEEGKNVQLGSTGCAQSPLHR